MVGRARALGVVAAITVMSGACGGRDLGDLGPAISSVIPPPAGIPSTVAPAPTAIATGPDPAPSAPTAPPTSTAPPLPSNPSTPPEPPSVTGVLIADVCHQFCQARAACDPFQEDWGKCNTACLDSLLWVLDCQQAWAAAYQCYTDVLRETQCDYATAHGKCSNLFSCGMQPVPLPPAPQPPTTSPPPPPSSIPLPSDGCTGSVSVYGPGECYATLSCKHGTADLYCYPDMGFTRCTCHSYGNGGESYGNYYVNYGDCRHAIDTCVDGVR